jgi:hypothetical protein
VGSSRLQVLKTRGGFTACIMIVTDSVAPPYSASMVKTLLQLLKSPSLSMRWNISAPRATETSHVHGLRTRINFKGDPDRYSGIRGYSGTGKFTVKIYIMVRILTISGRHWSTHWSMCGPKCGPAQGGVGPAIRDRGLGS